MATPIFCVKRASISQDTVDYIVQRAARKNSSGNPGLSGYNVYATSEARVTSLQLLLMAMTSKLNSTSGLSSVARDL